MLQFGEYRNSLVCKHIVLQTFIVFELSLILSWMGLAPHFLQHVWSSGTSQSVNKWTRTVVRA
jgi:hypothetical protein